MNLRHIPARNTLHSNEDGGSVACSMPSISLRGELVKRIQKGRKLSEPPHPADDPELMVGVGFAGQVHSPAVRFLANLGRIGCS